MCPDLALVMIIMPVHVVHMLQFHPTWRAVLMKDFTTRIMATATEDKIPTCCCFATWEAPLKVPSNSGYISGYILQIIFYKLQV